MSATGAQPLAVESPSSRNGSGRSVLFSTSMAPGAIVRWPSCCGIMGVLRTKSSACSLTGPVKGHREEYAADFHDGQRRCGRRSRFHAGMRGAKGTPYQGGRRVPSFSRWSGALQPGERRNLAAHIDIFPTLAELAGAPGRLAFMFLSCNVQISGSSSSAITESASIRNISAGSSGVFNRLHGREAAETTITDVVNLSRQPYAAMAGRMISTHTASDASIHAIARAPLEPNNGGASSPLQGASSMSSPCNYRARNT